ncbi:MAG: class I SAM-dependent methyltransferase [Candidatus Paceibacterota bacterium]
MEPKNKTDKLSFDFRIVEYEDLHKINKKQFDELVKAVDPQSNEVILDGMSGYGAVAKNILIYSEENNFNIEIYVLDNNKVQINRIKDNISDFDKDHIIQGNILNTEFSDNKFDKVVIKMGIHEVPKKEQSKIFKEVNRILKPGGKFIIWEVCLNDKNQSFFQDIIRKKDELSGFDKMVNNRYLPNYRELTSLFKENNFSHIEDNYKTDFVFSVRDRKDELVSKEKILMNKNDKMSKEEEDQLDKLSEKRIEKLINYIKSKIPKNLKSEEDFKDFDNNIEIYVDQVIMSAIKK